MKKKIIITLIIVLFIGIGLGLYVHYKPNKSDNNTKTNEEVTIIGNDDYGYLKLPGNWYKFQDVEGKSALQYSIDSVWIVTIEAYTPNMVDQTAETMAKTELNNLQNNEEGVINTSMASLKLADYDAYQVYGLYTNDNIWLSEWFFEPGDGKIHYISVEGPDHNSDYFAIPKTFSLTKIK